MGWNHIIGQGSFQVVKNLLPGQVFSFPDCKVCGQHVSSLLRNTDNHRFLYFRNHKQAVFNLLRFNAVSVDFNHKIHAAGNHKVSIFIKIAPVAGMNQNLTVLAWKKSPSAFFFPVQIAAGIIAFYADFFIFDCDFVIFIGFTNRDVFVFLINFKIADAGKGFAHSVNIPYFKIRRIHVDNPLGSHKNPFYRKIPVINKSPHNFQHLRMDKRHVDFIFLIKIKQLFDVKAGFAVNNKAGSALQKDRKQIRSKGGKLEGLGRGITDSFKARHQFKGTLGSRCKAIVVMNHPLGLSCGA